METWDVQTLEDPKTGERTLACPLCGHVARAWTATGAADVLIAHMNQLHTGGGPARGNA